MGKGTQAESLGARVIGLQCGPSRAIDRARFLGLLLVAACTNAELPSESHGDASGGSQGSGSMSGVTDAGSSAGGVPSSTEPAWCDVHVVLASKCQRCHREPPVSGAPFPLLVYEDTQVVDRRGVMRFERIAGAIESGTMPPWYLDLSPPVELLNSNEEMLLLEWVANGGKPVGGTKCDE